MKKAIKLLELALVNFKGIKDLKIEFNVDSTDIYGDNGTGKTTIFDAFTWLFFGKDSNDRKDFEIKTLDEFNQPIPKIEHEVSGKIEVDGNVITLRRVLQEKWVKQRGALESTFQGNETLYYWNDIPMSMGDFNKRVGELLDEKVFKLISNPFAFDALNWKDRRNVLLQIVGEVSDAEIAAGNSEYEELVKVLSKYKDFEEYRKVIESSIKKAKDDLKLIPTRIDEVQRGKPQTMAFDRIRETLTTKESDLAAIDQQITDKGAAFNAVYEKRNSQQSTISRLRVDMSQIETRARIEAKNKIAEAAGTDDTILKALSARKSELESATTGIASLEAKAKSLTSNIESITQRMNAKRDEWNIENGKEISFNDADACCPTCKRDFDPADLEAKRSEMKDNFDAAKLSKLADITNQGKNMAAERDALQAELNTLNERIQNGNNVVSTLQEEISKLTIQVETQKSEPSDLPSEELVYESVLSMNPDYKSMGIELKKIEESLTDMPVIDDSQLKASRTELQNEIASLKKDLQVEDQIKAADQRVEQLQLEEGKLAQQIADVEKTQYVIDQFNKLKIDTLEGRINERFSFVKFKLFEKQINGGETECCEALIGGVPFSNANTASRINAGIDIINTLCDYYKVSAPIFIDNRESVIRLVDSESQIISLIVREGSELCVGLPSYLAKEKELLEA